MSSSSSDDDISFIVLAGILNYRLKKNKKKRKYWVHPSLSDRAQKGFFYCGYQEIKEDAEKFYNFTKMSKQSFNELLKLIEQPCTKTNTSMRVSIKPEEKLLIVLRYLGSGCLYVDLHHLFRVGLSTARTIIQEVCRMLWKYVSPLVFPQLTTEKWLEIAEGFRSNADFPNCIGAIGGKHLKMVGTNMIHDKARKNNSLVFFATCDTNHLFTYVDVGIYAQVCTHGVFKNSKLHTDLLNNTLNVPEPRSLDEGKIKCPFVFAGNEGLPSLPNVLRPFSGSFKVVEKKTYNGRLSRAYQYIDSTFEMLANKWGIFSRPLNVSAELSEDIIKACCVLHNFVMIREGYSFANDSESTMFKDLNSEAWVGADKISLGNRKIFANYFAKIDAMSK